MIGLTLRLDGVKVRAPFSCKIWHYGCSGQRVLPSDSHNPPIVEQVLPRSDDPLTMRIAPGPTTVPGALTTFEGGPIEPEEREDGRIQLRSWGRGVAAEWMVEIEPGTGEVDLSKLTGITLSISYDSFEEDATRDQPSLRSVEHAADTIRPGVISHALATLIAPAPANGIAIRLKSSNPAAVKVPGAVMVPAGATTATIPLEVRPDAAGASAVVTATGDFTLRTTVRFRRGPQWSPTSARRTSLAIGSPWAAWPWTAHTSMRRTATPRRNTRTRRWRRPSSSGSGTRTSPRSSPGSSSATSHVAWRSTRSRT